jgi:hypothetical protein
MPKLSSVLLALVVVTVVAVCVNAEPCWRVGHGWEACGCDWLVCRDLWGNRVECGGCTRFIDDCNVRCACASVRAMVAVALA